MREFDSSDAVDIPSIPLFARTIPLYGCMYRHSCYTYQIVLGPSMFNPRSTSMDVIHLPNLDTDTTAVNYASVDILETVGYTFFLKYTYVLNRKTKKTKQTFWSSVTYHGMHLGRLMA